MAQGDAADARGELVVDAAPADDEVDGHGVAAFELRWLPGDDGPARGRAGEEVEVWWNDEPLGSFDLLEDPVAGLADYCRFGDVRRLWAGAVQVA